MSSVTIKDIPDDVMKRLRQRAAADHRSLNREVIHLLDAALSGDPETKSAAARDAEAEVQTRAWQKLAGRWVSDQSAEEEVADIYSTRTQGRPVDL